MFWELFNLQHMRKCGNFSAFIALALNWFHCAKYRNYSNISTPLEFRPQSFCQNYNYFFDSLNFDHPNLKKMNISTINPEQNRPPCIGAAILTFVGSLTM